MGEAINIKDNFMLDKSIGLLLIKLSFPPMAGMMIYSMFSLVDTFFVAKLGSISLAALTVCIPVLILITSIASATGVGLTSLLSRTLGAGDIKTADNIAWHGLIIGIGYGVFFLLLNANYIDNLLILFGCTPETFVLSKQYLHIILLGCIFTFIPMILGNIIQGEGNTFFPMFVSLIGIALNVIFDPLLIFGFGSFEGMGLKGAAIASVAAEIISSIIIIIYILKKRSFLTWAITNFSPSLKILIDIYKVGIPAMIMEVTGVVIMAFLNRVLAGFSCTAIATLGIFLRVRSLIYMPVYGLAQGAMPIAGFAYGVKNLDRVKETIIKVSVLAFLIMGGAWILIQFYPVWIMDFFSDEPALTLLGITCLRMATLFLPLMGPLTVLYSVLQALGKGTTAMWLSLIRQVIFFLPLLVILPHYLSLKGVWLAFSLSELLTSILAACFLIRLWRELQMKNKVPVVMLLKLGYTFKRIMAWLKW
jgi:putative MATE family efflux protein